METINEKRIKTILESEADFATNPQLAIDAFLVCIMFHQLQCMYNNSAKLEKGVLPHALCKTNPLACHINSTLWEGLLVLYCWMMM